MRIVPVKAFALEKGIPVHPTPFPLEKGYKVGWMCAIGGRDGGEGYVGDGRMGMMPCNPHVH